MAVGGMRVAVGGSGVGVSIVGGMVFVAAVVAVEVEALVGFGVAVRVGVGALQAVKANRNIKTYGRNFFIVPPEVDFSSRVINKSPSINRRVWGDEKRLFLTLGCFGGLFG